MNIPAVVVSLIGQAWAQTANGERRELRVGDRLRGDEVLVTAPGAQADLDFGNNRILSFVGEQSTPLDVAVAVTNKATPVPVLDAQGEAPLEPGAQAVSAQGSDSVSEGHNFVQLVRIGEIIEADGITPLSVARIKELLRPMGMSLPERDFEANEWREHWGTDSHSHSHGADADTDTDTRTPGLSIELQGAGPDGVYSAEEIGPDGTITAKIVLDDKVREGDILVVRDSNGNELLNRPVTAQDLLNGVVVEVPVSPGQGQVSVEAEVTTGSGLGGTDNDDKPVDNQVPVAAQPIVDRSDADMDPISLDLGSHFSDANQLTFNATGLPPGLSFDPVSGVVSGILDKSASQGVPGGEYQVTITATDAAGNSTSQTFTWTVDNPAPVAKDDNAVTAEDTPVSGNVLTGAGSDSPLISADSDPDGDSLSVVGFVVAGDSTVYVPGDIAIIPNVGSLKLNADGSYIFTPDKNWNGTVPSVTYTISDGEGGSATADLNIVVSPVNDAPTALVTPPDQSGEDADSITPVTLDLPNLFNDVDGDTLTYSIAGLPPGLI
ncbi:MAG: Ig-like domain-containing protein, partial [Pseudomonadota bacterium]